MERPADLTGLCYIHIARGSGEDRESCFWCGTCYTCKSKHRRTEQLLSHVENNAVLQRSTVFSTPSPTPLHRSWIVWTVFVGKGMLSKLNSTLALTSYLLCDLLWRTDKLQFNLSGKSHRSYPPLLTYDLFL